MPGVDDYVIGIGDSPDENRPIVRRPGSLAQTFARNRNDDVTRFLRDVSERVVSSLPSDIKPDRQSRWAGDHGFGYFYRYYRWWYSRPPWGNGVMVYLINLSREKDSPDTYQADVGLGWWLGADVDVVSRVTELHVYDEQMSWERLYWRVAARQCTGRFLCRHVGRNAPPLHRSHHAQH